MADDFEYISHARLEYHEGYRARISGRCPNPSLRSPGSVAPVLRRQGRAADRLDTRPHRRRRRG